MKLGCEVAAEQMQVSAEVISAGLRGDQPLSCQIDSFTSEQGRPTSTDEGWTSLRIPDGSFPIIAAPQHWSAGPFRAPVRLAGSYNNADLTNEGMKRVVDDDHEQPAAKRRHCEEWNPGTGDVCSSLDRG